MKLVGIPLPTDSREENMLLLTSINEQLGNLGTVASIAREGVNDEISGKEDLAENYRRFIEKYYKRVPDKVDLSAGRSTRLVINLDECAKMSSIFVDGPASRIDDLDQVTAISFDVIMHEQERKSEIVRQGLDFLRLASWEHDLLVDLIVTDMVILPSTVAYGGSTSDGLGIIWANPNLNWRMCDTAEFVVHELAHQCMFIDEICHGHYDYGLLMRRENWAQSAILHKLRPVDKVLHSVVVALELLHFRELVGHPASSKAHPPTTKLVRQTEAAIKSLQSTIARAPTLLKPRAFQILDKCAEHLSVIEARCALEA